MSAQRAEVYQDRLLHPSIYESTKAGWRAYVLANHALEQLQMQISTSAKEPSQRSIDGVAHRLEIAAAENDTSDTLVALRSRCIRAYLLPIVWANLLSMDGLTSAEARRASERIELTAAHDAATGIASDALIRYDAFNGKDLSDNEHKQRAGTVGFLNEVTYPLLTGKPNTAKQFALPSLAYDDDLNPAIHEHIDGIYYDNRHGELPRRQFGYQIKSLTSGPRHKYGDIPVISEYMLGNKTASYRWPQDDERFTTVRKLVDLRHSPDSLDEASRSTLDSITSEITNIITR